MRKELSAIMLATILLFAVNVAAEDSWKRLFPDYPTHGFNDIYSVSATNVYAVGNYGLIYHYDGSSWAEMASPVAVNLNGIWGRAANDIFAVGNDGTILWYNGSTWQKLSSPTSSHLFCVWGFDGSGSQVYAGGRNAEILVYSNNTWTNMDTPLADGIWNYTTINSIWGDSPSNLYAVGQTEGDVNTDIYLSYSGGASWEREYPFPDTTNSSKPGFVKGFIGQDVYIAGRDGVYRMINGNWASWEKILSENFSDIWGTTHESIWFVNTNGITHYNGNTSTILSSTTASSGNKIWGSSDTDIFVVTGSDGEIHHFQGEAWSSMTKTPNLPVQSICGAASDALYAVGDNGMILSYNGEYWSPMESATNENLHSVCGSGNAIFAVGNSDTVLFYNGSQWNQVNSGTTGENLYDAWCYSSSAAYVVGTNGTILNCTSSGCTAESTDGTTSNLYAVHHSTMGPYAGGAGGALLYKASTTWNQVSTVPTGTDIMDLWGDPAFGLVAVGGQYIHSYNTTSQVWTKEYESPTTLHLNGVAGTAISDLYAVGYGGSFPYDGIVLHKEGSIIQEIKTVTEQYLNTVLLASGELFTGSDGGTVYRHDGTHWNNMINTAQLRDIWGSAPDDLFAVGYSGRILHYDGTQWSPMDSGTTTNLETVYVSEDGQSAVAGGWPNSDQKILRYDGSTWSTVTIPTTESISGLWGSGSKILAVAWGTVLSSNNSGLSWASETTPIGTGYLNGVWGAGSNGPFFAVGDNAEILTSDGSGTWSSMSSGALSYLRLWDVWGSSADNVYAVGDTEKLLGANESQIIHFDGTTWQSDFYSYNVLPPQYMNAIWGRSQSDIFTFGSQPFRNDLCSSGWEKMSIAGVPPLKSTWGIEGANGVYYIFGVADIGQAVYQFTISADRKCPSFPWTMFLPAIINNAKQ